MPFHYIELSPSTALTNSSTPQAKSSFLLGKTGGASWCHRSSNLCHIPFFFATGPSNNWHSTFKLVQTIFTSWLYCIKLKIFWFKEKREWGKNDWQKIGKTKKLYQPCQHCHSHIAFPGCYHGWCTLFHDFSERRRGYVKMMKKAQLST